MERREPRLMRAGDVVLIEVNGGERANFVTLEPGKSVDLGKRVKIPVESLLGAPFGSAYEVGRDTGEATRLGPERGNDGEEANVAPKEDERSNKHVSNRSGGEQAQTLTDGEITALRKNFSAEEVVTIISAYSKTFEEKTAFAQEKYRARKLKKHMTKFLARYPSPRQVCEQYFYANPQKISHMRFDSLSMLMHAGNIGAHAQPLVVDTCGGLVVGSIVTRMGGLGRVCNAFIGQSPMSMDILLKMNLDESHFEAIRHASISSLIAERARIIAGEPKEKKETPAKTTDLEEKEKKERKFMKIKFASEERVEEFARQGFTSLVVASLSIEPKAALEQLLPLCASSASFAVWFHSAQPLAEALYHLRNANMAINLSLVEPFLREQQVLPGRTHPVMTTDAGAGGWILSGTYVAPVEDDTNKPVIDDDDDDDDVKRRKTTTTEPIGDT
jgi:tRNA (adenine-N(1)-)-methyltransferase non-catalytic subunit